MQELTRIKKACNRWKRTKKLQTFDSCLFIGQNYFSNDGAQFYLIFQPIYKTITTFSGLKYTISQWESKGLSNKKFQPPYTANKFFSPELVWMNNYRIRLRFEGSCLKQKNEAACTPKNVVIFFVIYELDSWPWDFETDFTLGGCLFEGVKLTKNADPDKYLYTGYGIGFDTRGHHSLPDGGVGKNVIIFGVDMNSSVHIDNKEKGIAILGGKGITQGLNYTLTAETQYSINFTSKVQILFNPAL